MKQTYATLMKIAKDLENDPGCDPFLHQQIYGTIACINSLSGAEAKDSFIATAVVMLVNAAYIQGSRHTKDAARVTPLLSNKGTMRLTAESGDSPTTKPAA